MENIICQSWWYWLIAAVISIFQGYRGFIIQLQLVEKGKNDLIIEKAALEANLQVDSKTTKEQNNELIKLHEKKFVFYAKTNCQSVCLRAIPYCFFYLLTTFLGFIALFFVYYVLIDTCIDAISGGTAALIIFAVLYGIIGITGQLPALIEQGKLPK